MKHWEEHFVSDFKMSILYIQSVKNEMPKIKRNLWNAKCRISNMTKHVLKMKYDIPDTKCQVPVIKYNFRNITYHTSNVKYEWRMKCYVINN